MAFGLLRMKPDLEKNEITMSPYLLPYMSRAFFGDVRVGGEQLSIRADREDSTTLITLQESPKSIKVRII